MSNVPRERPLSPHLQVYTFQFTMLLSTLHRLTGIFLTFGTPLLVFWLYTLQGGEELYARAQSFFSYWLVQLMLIGWVFSLFYHLCNGVRHLVWDIGKGFEISSVYKSGYWVLAVSALLTAGTLALAYGKGGLL